MHLGEAFSPPYHGSQAVVRKSGVMFDCSNSKEDGYLEVYGDQMAISALSTKHGLERQSWMRPQSKSLNLPSSR